MKIAYICADQGIPVFGQKGCSIHVQEVLRAFRHLGATVELFTCRLGGEAPDDLKDIPVHHLPAPAKTVPQALREQQALATNATLEAQLQAQGPFDLVYERYSLWSYAGMEFSRHSGIPGLLEVNAPLIEEQAEHRELVHHDRATQVATQLFQAATCLIAVSREVKQYLSQWSTDGRVVVIPNGVNQHRFHQSHAASRPIEHNIYTIGFVGSIKLWHGLDKLVEAFAQLHRRVPQARLLIVGDGPQRSCLEDAIAHYGLGLSVQWVGAVPPEQIPHWLNLMDVAVAPYPNNPDFYFSPLKVLEYMAAGLPIVASRIGQLTEILTEDVNGLLCPPGDIEALASQLELLWRSPQRRLRLGQAARQHVLTHYTWDGVAQKIIAIARAHNSVNSQLCFGVI